MSSPSVSLPPAAGGTVVLACHHQLLTAGLKHTLDAAGWTVAGVGKTADRARALVAAENPDMCLVLVPFPDGAAELVEALTAMPGRPRVVCLSTDHDLDDQATVVRVFQAGADGWLTLDLSPEVLGRTLDAVRAGEAALSRRHVRILLSDLRRPTADVVQIASGSSVELTPRQQQVLKAMAQAGSTKSIATALGISSATVRWHVAELLHKFEVSSRAELAVLLQRSSPGR